MIIRLKEGIKIYKQALKKDKFKSISFLTEIEKLK